jgi:hypothetical protein
MGILGKPQEEIQAKRIHEETQAQSSNQPTAKQATPQFNPHD